MRRSEMFYQAGLILLAIGSIGLLLFELTHELKAQELNFLSQIDVAIALLFLADFIAGLVRAKDKSEFWKERWYEIFACIPLTNEMVQALRGLRILRMLQLLRLIRLLRAASRIRRLLDFAFDGPRFALLSLVLSTSTLLFVAVISFHTFEYGVNQNVKSLYDSFWWGVVTITSTGYGDIYPVTPEGRIVAMLLMLTGIGTLGLAFNTIATYAVANKERYTNGKDNDSA